MSEELKPCPRCKSVDVASVGCLLGWWVECNNCAAEGPYSSTKEGAEAAWAAATTKEKSMISDEDIKYFASVHAGGPIGEIATELLQLREEKRTPCRWEQDMDGNWQTGCDNMFVLNDGALAENRMNFCTYCGHQIEEMP